MRRTRQMLLALIVASPLLSVVGPSAAQEVSAVSGGVEAEATVFFDGLRGRCDNDDFPDIPPRAFRDAAGTVHLLATHHVNRQMLGPSLRNVAHTCDVVFRGRRDPRPEAYDDYGWLVAPYTPDGTTVYSLVHNEFHGNEHARLCPSRVYLRCWENTITWAVSHDGGHRFARPPGPGALVAALPYRYAGDRPRQIGYFNPTNIVSHQGFFYAMFTMIDPVRSDWGVCLMRTGDLADPASWRSWDGSGFNIRHVSPYLAAEADPKGSRCQPVGSGRLFASLGSVSWMPQAGAFVLTMRFQSWDKPRGGEVPGAYIATSANLIEWSTPRLLMADHDVGPANVFQFYPALLDPDAPDRNFQMISGRPLLFTIEIERGRANHERRLVARQATLEPSR